MNDETHVIIVMPIKAMPKPAVPSIKVICAECQAKCWIDGRFAPEVLTDPKAIIWCISCGVENMAKQPDEFEVRSLQRHYREHTSE